MTRRPQENGQSQAKAGSSTLVLGIDESGKPKGARFGADQAQAAQAAQSLKLQVYEVGSESVREIAQKLPTGKIYAKGRDFIPYIKRELYDQVIAAADGRGSESKASAGVAPPTGPASPFLESTRWRQRIHSVR